VGSRAQTGASRPHACGVCKRGEARGSHDRNGPLRRRSLTGGRRFETASMVEEALLRIELSPDVDEVRGFDPE